MQQLEHVPINILVNDRERNTLSLYIIYHDDKKKKSSTVLIAACEGQYGLED